MKTRILLGALACVGSLVGAQTARAQAQAPIVAKGVAVESKEAANEQASTRVSDFLNTEIVTEKGESLGVVKDLVISNSSGTVQYVVVGGDSGDFRAIPWKALALYQGSDAKDRYFILGMEKEQYHKAPLMPQKDWTNFSQPAWTNYVPQVNQYYSNARAVRPAAVRRERRLERALTP